MRRLLSLVALLPLALAACGGDNVTVQIPSSASPTTASPSPSSSPSPSVPDASSVDASLFLRPGTELIDRAEGDMNGVPPDEIVLISRATESQDAGPPQSYVDAYAWNPGPAEWIPVFDATLFTDPGGANQGPVLDAAGDVGQLVELAELLDFEGDGAPELALAILNVGASSGPLDLWILSWRSEAFTTEFSESTERGGSLNVTEGGQSLQLETGKYAPGDPGCCPSQIETQVIGFDPGSGEIRILSSTVVDAGG